MLVSYRSWKKMLSLEAVSEVGSLQGAIAN
jgi:hypothetical protein